MATADTSKLLPDQVETSIYIQNSNSDFKVIMCSPYIEYNIPGYNFSFVKHLSRDEIQTFIGSNFEDWENNSLRILSSVKKFKDELNLAN